MIRPLSRIRNSGKRLVIAIRQQWRRARMALRDPWNAIRFALGFLEGMMDRWRFTFLGVMLSINLSITAILMMAVLRIHTDAATTDIESIGVTMKYVVQLVLGATFLVFIKSGVRRGYDRVELPESAADGDGPGQDPQGAP